MATLKKGRVLHLIDTGGPGGAETVYLELVRALPGHGWESIPVVPETDWLAGALQEVGFDPLELSSTRSFDARFVRRLRQVIRREKIDLVQTHLLSTSFYATAACLGTGVPVVSTFHGVPDIPEAERFRRVKVGLLRRRRNRVVFVSSFLRDYFTKRGDFGDATETIHNGIDTSAYSPGRNGRLRRELGIGEGPVIGAVGNVRPSKDYAVLLRAFAQTRAQIPDAHLVVAGQASGQSYDALLRLQGELGIAECTHFVGFRSDVAEFLGSLDVFAMSSSDEGFSLATVQAMATGLPVVATRSGGPEEIVGKSGAALLVPTRDPHALAEAILRVLHDPRLSEELGAMARRHVEERFSVDLMVERYATLYGRMV